MQERVESFRLAFVPTCLMILGMGLLASLIWVAVFLCLNVKSNGLWIGLGGVAVLAPVVTFLLVLFFPVSVAAWGLRAFDAWGWYHNVQWSEITAVRPLNLCGLRYLRLDSGKDRRPIWLPIFLSDLGRFRSVVLQHAGTTNPLTVALRATGKRAHP
jgi:hypothetical protein